MFREFLTAAVVFHLLLTAVSMWMGRRWVRWTAKPAAGPLWAVRLLADSFLFGGALLVLAALLGLTVPYSNLGTLFFPIIRLICQGLFGEGVLLTAWVAALHLRAKRDGQVDIQRTVRGGVLLALLGLLVGVYWDAYHHCPYDLQVRRYSLDLRRDARTAGRLRLVHLSDIQTDRVKPYEERVFREVLALNPDLVLLTGDYAQRRLTTNRPQLMRSFNEFLRRTDLRPPLGAYAVKGDADWTDWQALFRGTAIRCLSDGSVQVPLAGGRSLALTGLDVNTSRRRDARGVTRVLAQASAGDLHFVFGHAPDFVEHLPGTNVDLALAGHTHGGQIVLPGIGPLATATRLPRRYAGGMHHYQGVALVVSRGIGMERLSAPPIRFFCPPEICVVEIVY